MASATFHCGASKTHPTPMINIYYQKSESLKIQSLYRPGDRSVLGRTTETHHLHSQPHCEAPLIYCHRGHPKAKRSMQSGTVPSLGLFPPEAESDGENMEVEVQVWKAMHHQQHSIMTRDLCGEGIRDAFGEQRPHAMIASVCLADQIVGVMTKACFQILRASSRPMSRRHRDSSSFENPLHRVKRHRMV